MKTSDNSSGISAILTYVTNDGYVHLTMWKDDKCLDRKSMHILDLLKSLKIPHSIALNKNPYPEPRVVAEFDNDF